MNSERITESDLMALAAHLHVQLRRRTGRVTDVEWMVSNADYAQAVTHLAKATATAEGVPELGLWAARFELALMKVQRPHKPLLSALNATTAYQKNAHDPSFERQELATDFKTTQYDSQLSDGIVSEFGDSHRKVDTSQLAPRKPLREAYVWSLR